MLIVTGLIVIAEPDVDAARKAAAEMARATRLEEGCRTYAFYQNVEDATMFRVYEEWDDEAALKAHFETPHMAKFRATLAKLEIVSRNIISVEAGRTSQL